MKIAIQGHPTRGKEIIQILESFGGINDGLHEGNNPDCYYEIHGNIIWCVSTKGINFKYCTLEEFEQEFPFKVGDKILIAGPISHSIIALEYFNNKLCYKLDNGFHYAPSALRLYKEMKEERNITLTLDKAKEWYKKGGELKEVALQAYSEKELNSRPKSWVEFCTNYPIQAGEAIIAASTSKISPYKGIATRDLVDDRNVCPSQKSAEAHLAMIQLEQLRDCWRQGWKPIWDISHKWCIRLDNNELYVGLCTDISRFLTFPTREMAEEFLKCFRDLIEKAGDLI